MLESWLLAWWMLESLAAGCRMLAVRMGTCGGRRIGGCWRAGCKLLAAGELAAGWWMLESWLLAGGCWQSGWKRAGAGRAGCSCRLLESWLLAVGCWRAGCWSDAGCADGNVPEE
jgi:hypothetical protein